TPTPWPAYRRWPRGRLPVRYRPPLKNNTCVAAAPGRRWGNGAGGKIPPASLAVEEFAVLFDVLGEIQGVPAGQLLGRFRVASFQGFDDLQMIDYGTRGAIALGDGGAADGAHMQQQILGGVEDGLRPAECDHGRMKCNVGVGVLVQMLGRRRAMKLIEQMPQLGDFFV